MAQGLHPFLHRQIQKHCLVQLVQGVDSVAPEEVHALVVGLQVQLVERIHQLSSVA